MESETMTPEAKAEARAKKLHKTMERVRKLIAMAEAEISPSATPEERAATEVEQNRARQQADALMLENAIEEAMVNDAMPASQRSKPGILDVAIAGGDTDVVGWIGSLATNVARHCRCIIKLYSGFQDGQWMARVYGHEGDLAYFEVLYTTVRLHMVGALRPEVRLSESLEDNAYRLHNAGYNWFEIARMYGWVKFKDLPYGRREELRERWNWVRDYTGKNDLYYNKREDRVEPSQKVGDPIKRAYERVIKGRGEPFLKISASGSKTYRRSAARGYSTRLSQRLREAERGRQTGGAEVLLASAAQDLNDFFREDNEHAYSRCPRCHKLSSDPYTCEFCGQFIKDKPEECPRCAKNPSGTCRDHPMGRSGRYKEEPFDQRAYQAGVAHANTADLGTQNRAPSGSRKEI